MNKCSKCGAVISDNDYMAWKCMSCGKAFKVNLSKLKQVQAQKDKLENAGKTLLKCPACGNGMDDGNEKIACKCSACGNVSGGNLKYFVSEEKADKKICSNRGYKTRERDTELLILNSLENKKESLQDSSNKKALYGTCSFSAIIFVMVIIAVISQQNIKLNSDVSILKEYGEYYEYNGKYYFSNGKYIYAFDISTNKTNKVAKGAKVYAANEKGVFYSKNANTLVEGGIWCIDYLSGRERKIISDKVYDMVYYKNRIYYSSIKPEAVDGADGNWEPIRSVDLNGEDKKEYMMNDQCWGFVLYENNGIDYLCYADNNLLQICTLDLENVYTGKFFHINSVVEKEKYIYVTDSDAFTSNLYIIDKNTYEVEKIDNLTGYLIDTKEKIYGELYKNAEDYADKKWYHINYPNCTLVENY